MSHKSTVVRYLMRKESWKAHTTMHAIRHHTPRQEYATHVHPSSTLILKKIDR
jgi:hypothetical protein